MSEIWAILILVVCGVAWFPLLLTPNHSLTGWGNHFVKTIWFSDILSTKCSIFEINVKPYMLPTAALAL